MNAAEKLPSPLGLSLVADDPKEPERRIERTDLRSPEEIENLRIRISSNVAILTVKNAPHFTRPGEETTPGKQLCEKIAELSAQGVETIIIEGEQGERRFPSPQDQLDNIWVARFNKYKSKIKQVIGGTQSPDEKDQERVAEQGFAMGLDATLLLAPSDLQNDFTELEQHLQRNLNKGPALIHSGQEKSNFILPEKIVLKLKNHANFVGILERDGAERIQKWIQAGIHVWAKKNADTQDLFEAENPLLHEVT